MKENNDILTGIIWGSRLFVNVQFTYRLVSLLISYYEGECTLQHIFRFTHALLDQKKVKLYKELKNQLEDFIPLECLLADGELKGAEKNATKYTVNRMYRHFVKNFS